MPRSLPDGTRNPFYIQRLKDKIGNKSNASSEIEFRNTRAWIVGPEGRGIATLIEMAQLRPKDSGEMARVTGALGVFEAPERVKVLDRVEHPPLKPGVPVTVFPGSIGGLNYSPGAYDPKTGYIFNAAAETAGVLIQQKLDAEQKKKKFLLGDVFLGLENGNFGQYLPGWKDHGSVSAIDVKTEASPLPVNKRPRLAVKILTSN